MALVDLEGVLAPVVARTHGDRSPQAVLRDIAALLGAVRRRHGRRLRIVSVAVAGTTSTSGGHRLLGSSRSTVMSGGQVIWGGALSFTTTCCSQRAVLPLPSSATQKMVVLSLG
jgi:hypothetical protein